MGKVHPKNQMPDVHPRIEKAPNRDGMIDKKIEKEVKYKKQTFKVSNPNFLREEDQS